MGIFLIFMNAAVTGCSGEKNDHPSESEKEEKLIEDTLQKSEEPLYPVLIDDIEILIGETTIQSLLDNGLRMDIFETTPSYEYYEHILFHVKRRKQDVFITSKIRKYFFCFFSV